MPLASCGVALGPGDDVPDCVWVGPDLLPGKPGFPAPLFCAKADPSKIVERASAAIIVRMGLPRMFSVRRPLPATQREPMV
jgi:hypothetical protein